MGIEAVITSVDDPQLERCMASVKNQTVPFSNIIHLNNVFPNSAAMNQGFSQTKDDWIMWIGGDMILHLDAVEKISRYMRENTEEKISGYYFGLRDTFLNCRIGFLSVINGPLYRTIQFEDNFINDWKVVRRLRKQGWNTKENFYFIVGSHFDNPNEYQVFKRCYVHQIRFMKYHKRSLRGKLTHLFQKTGNPLYQVGIQAIEYADKKQFYPGSHDLRFDRENYEEWKKLGLASL